VIVVAFVVIKNLTTPKQGGVTHKLSAFAGLTTVPASTIAKIGPGPLTASQLPLQPLNAPLYKADGKPDMLYIGAEFCPYCAAMRWSMAVALSRFGTLGPLKGIHSSSQDVYPNTATLTFLHQKYSSPYLTFTPIENETVTHAPLQNPNKTQLNFWEKYDSSQGGLGYPFIYFGGKAVLTGPLYDPGVLKGLTWSQISGQLSNPNSTVAQNVIGAANFVTASICKMTGNAPASVCQAAPIPAIEAKL
jgi:hypothetical protein